MRGSYGAICNELLERAVTIGSDAEAKMDRCGLTLEEAQTYVAEELAKLFRQGIRSLLIEFAAARTIKMLGN